MGPFIIVYAFRWLFWTGERWNDKLKDAVRFDTESDALEQIANRKILMARVRLWNEFDDPCRYPGCQSHANSHGFCWKHDRKAKKEAAHVSHASI